MAEQFSYMTLGIAIYGAVVATVNATINVLKEIRDNPRLKVDIFVGNFMQFSPFSQHYELKKDELKMIVTVTNVGRRPVQITQIGGEMKALEQGRSEFVIVPRPGVLPKHLKEHESLTEIIQGIDAVKKLLSNSRTFFAYDVTGKKHYVSRKQFKKAVSVTYHDGSKP